MNSSRALIALVLLFLSGCATIPPTPEELGSRAGWHRVGEVRVEERGWNWFFSPGWEVRRAEIIRMLEQRAVAMYGEDAEIQIVEMEGRWNPLSLLMVVGAAGIVEDVKAVASVWLPVEEIPRPEPEVEVEERFYRVVVQPYGNYNSSSEYTRVGYKTQKMLERELSEEYDRGELSAEEFEERLQTLPSGGALMVSLGRTEMFNVISKWFTFSLLQGEEVLVSMDGWDDIPYIPGSDSLWWNELVLPMEVYLEPPFEFHIVDRFQNKSYTFSISLEEVDG